MDLRPVSTSRLRAVWASLLPGLALAALVGSARAELSDARVEELFRLSGTKGQVAGVLVQLRADLSQRVGEIPEPVAATLLEAAEFAFAAPKLEAGMIARIRAEMDPGHAERALEWLRSDAGKAIARVEQAGSSPEEMAKLESYAATLESSPPQEARVELIVRLNEASRAADFGAQIATQIGVATVQGIGSASGQAESAEQIRAAFESQGDQLRSILSQAMVLTNLFVYRDVDDESLGAYVVFLETDAGQGYIQVVSRALVEAISRASEEFGRRIAKSLPAVDAES